jgi:hypothetical protein
VRFDPHEVKFDDCVAIGGFLLWVRRCTLDRRSGEGQMAEEKQFCNMGSGPTILSETAYAPALPKAADCVAQNPLTT